ncbi:MAG TPA: hypothetical protein VM819_09600 [Vicinamibacterales bacterium]|nr:hypothetical protein [Vicinamibacterales bacterium]
MDHNPSGRRPHYHRGRRGTDRRGSDRRVPQQSAEQGGRPSADQVDVEQIMREIRNRISQRHGIEFSTQQIQDLAARRLEAILEPRNINPTLLEQLRKGAAAPQDPLPPNADAADSFADDAIYAGSPLVRFFRRLFNPLLKLLFNPAPVVSALQAQGRRNQAVATRTAELERRQTEWNALHYQILQRLVTEVSRASIEMQALSQRVEALAARVDFNDRRVRTLETAPPPARSPRPQETAPTATSPAATSPAPAPPETATTTNSSPPAADAPRRRRRRRRGRRGSIVGTESSATPAAANAVVPDDAADLDEGDDEEALEESPSGEPTVESAAEIAVADTAPAAEPAVLPVPSMPEPAALPSPGPAPEPSPVDALQTAAPPTDEAAPEAPVRSPDPNTPEQ